MTNEEAVKVLEDMKVKIAIPKAAELQRKRNEAIDMAIEALSSSEIPNNSDTVSRQAAIIQLSHNKKLGDDEWEIAVDYDIQTIRQLPSAEPKTGRWIDIDSETYTWKIRCNKCGHERSMMSTQGVYPRFCEGCGFKMEV